MSLASLLLEDDVPSRMLNDEISFYFLAGKVRDKDAPHALFLKFIKCHRKFDFEGTSS
jgi:hypothetical protein